jgi:glutaredoxin-related protein
MGQALAQTTVRDDTELLISQIQTDKRAVVLTALEMTDDQVRAFTPIYDKYQADMKKLSERAVEMLNKFAANYGSMTDEAAKDILKEWLELRDERNAITKKYAKEMGRALPPTKVLQWVQIENKLNALLDVQAASVIPVAR